jgi:23S rRNA (guanosine2251-2'-O)-methyltransferase
MKDKTRGRGGRQERPVQRSQERTKFEAPRRMAERPAEKPGHIYGALPVLEALRGNARRLERILVADGAREHRLNQVFELARDAGVRIERVSRESLVRIVGPDVNHQGVVAFASAAEYVSLDDILSDTPGPALIVLLDGVEDPRNLGAVLRTVECAGADGVIIPERRAVGLTDTVAKSSAGATEHVKVAKAANLNRVIDDLKQRNIWVVGTSGNAGMNYTEWDWKQPSALVLGAEGSGLHRLVSENCDVLVKIPMYGKIDSLNVSVAAGVILFEAKRQRGEER